MKKQLFFMIFFIFVGCSKPAKQGFVDWMETKKSLKILSTTAMIEDVVKEVGGELISSICLIVGDLDPHSYELVKGDDEKFQAADLVFYNGVGLEHGASVRYHLENDDNAVVLGDQVLKKYPDRAIAIDGEIDPHIWMDMDLFSEIVDPIIEALSRKDPIHASEYAIRGKLVKEKLKQKDGQLREMMQTIPEEKRFLVTSHDAFHYLAKRYLALGKEENWKGRVQAPQGLAPDGQMGVFDIQKVTEFLIKNHVHVVFPETNISFDPLRKVIDVCSRKGFAVAVAKAPLYGDTMGDASSYTEMMEHNIKILSSYMIEEYEPSISR